MGYGYLAYVALIFAFPWCVFYVRVGDFAPGPVEVGGEVCVTGPVASTAEALVSGAEGIVGFFVDLLSALVPG